MDALTHTLFAIILGRAGLNRLAPRATLMLVVAANLPDVDIVARLSQQAAWLRYYRGPTHALVLLPAVALLAAAVGRVTARKGFSWWWGLLVALIGAASGPLLDCATANPVRLLWPFSDRWFGADLIAAFDVWIWLMLLTALVIPWFSRLVSSEMGARSSSGRGAAIFMLCLLGLYGFGRYLSHQRALAVLDSRMYQNEVALRTAALPSPYNPLRWTGLVEGPGFLWRDSDVNLAREFDPGDGTIFYKPDAAAEIARARQTEGCRALLGFAQWPLWSVTPVAEPEKGVEVKLIDLRLGTPRDAQVWASAILDGEGRLVRSSFRF
jgi:inner membrane protein